MQDIQQKSGAIVERGMLSLDSVGPVQMGFWVPNRVWATAKFLVPLRKEIEAKREMGTLEPIQAVLQNLKNWIDANPPYRMWIHTMIHQANQFVADLDEDTKGEIVKDGDTLWIESYDALFDILNAIITTSPAFNETEMVGTPMNGLLAVSMATPAGLTLFHDAAFNAQFKKVLDAWNTFLKTSTSLDKLDINDPDKPGSWISDKAIAAKVWHQMEHDPNAPGFGFDSWNSFFLRQFVPGARPFKGDPKTQICIGCETTPWLTSRMQNWNPSSGSRTSTIRWWTSSRANSNGPGFSRAGRSIRASCLPLTITAGGPH